MFLLVDDRECVQTAYQKQFESEGIGCTCFNAPDFRTWHETALDDELTAIRAFVFFCVAGLQFIAETNKVAAQIPVLVLCDLPNLDKTLRLFALGADDVVKKPVHARELIARIGVMERRLKQQERFQKFGRLKVYFDGRDPEIDGESFPLPRREQRILEYLASIGNRRASKDQIFNSIYGAFNEDVEPTVIESHLCKLRKKLRAVLHHDPIDSKRFLGYRLIR